MQTFSCGKRTFGRDVKSRGRFIEKRTENGKDKDISHMGLKQHQRQHYTEIACIAGAGRKGENISAGITPLILKQVECQKSYNGAEQVYEDGEKKDARVYVDRHCGTENDNRADNIKKERGNSPLVHFQAADRKVSQKDIDIEGKNFPKQNKKEIHDSRRP